MRKFSSLMLLALVGLICSCSKDRLESNPNDGGPVDFRITTALPSDMLTKSTDSAMGGVTNVDKDKYDLRYICEVWTKEDAPRLAYRAVQTTNTFSDKMEFSARLLKKKYDFVFWADFVAKGDTTDLFYTTTNLKNIEMRGTYGISNDARDAYYASQTIEPSTAGTELIGLKRPFGKIRIVASDVPDDKQNVIWPKKVKFQYTTTSLPRGFNAFSGEVTDKVMDPSITPFLVDAVKVEKFQTGTNSQYGTCYVLAFDYIFASKAPSSVAFNLKIFSDDNATDENMIGEKDLSSIPVVANQLTTVIGNLYTEEGKVRIVVTDPFDNEEVSPLAVVDVDDIKALNEALAAASNSTNSIKLNVTDKVGGSDNIIIIPNAVMASNTPSVSLNFTNVASGTTINIADETPGMVTNNYDGNLYVTVSDKTELFQLNITVPNAHVVVYGSYGQILAQTSPTTFVVAKGATINTLRVAGGNVEIFGTVTTIKRDPNNNDTQTMVWLFDNSAVPTKAGTDPEQIIINGVTSGTITNDTKGINTYATIKEAVDVAASGDVIVLANGSYPLRVDVDKVKQNQDEYLRINKNLTIKCVAGEAVVYGATVINGGNHYAQSTIFVGNNAHVKFENITFMPHVNTSYAPGNTNKTIEVLQGARVEALNCKFTPNTKVGGYTTGGGSLYSAQSTSSATNCLFDRASFSVDGLMSGTLLVDKCVFDKGFISTVNWTSNTVANSTMVIDVKNTKFINTNQAPVAQERIVRAAFGTINLDGCTFPTTTGTYWQAAGFGKVYVNYAGSFAKNWTKDRTQPKGFAVADKIIAMTNDNTQPQIQSFYSWQGCKSQPLSAELAPSWELETSLKVTDEANSAKSVWLYVQDNNGEKYYLSVVYAQVPELAGWQIFNPTKSATSETWYNQWDAAGVDAQANNFNTVKFLATGDRIDILINSVKASTYALKDGVTASKVLDVTFNSRNVASSTDYISTWTFPVLK